MNSSEHLLFGDLHERLLLQIEAKLAPFVSGQRRVARLVLVGFAFFSHPKLKLDQTNLLAVSRKAVVRSGNLSD